MSDTAMTLLERHKPVLRYDSHEIYFADSAAIWTDNPGHVLKRGPDGTALAQTPASPPTPLLSLRFLGHAEYANGAATNDEDLIGCPHRDYAEQARRLHAMPQYANRVYGRLANGTDGRIWLQYWFFYFYNDFELLGDAFPAGLHEGDWEVVQLRMDDAGATPDVAVYSRHKHAAARRWQDVERVEQQRPVVYVARGSHAGYFRAGTQWGEHWWDHADGRGQSPELTLEVAADGDPAYAWLRWRGYWGDTKPHTGSLLGLLDDTSPRGPGGHGCWKDPYELLQSVSGYEQYTENAPVSPTASATSEARPAASLPEPPAPHLTVSRSRSGLLKVAYECLAWPTELRPLQLLVTLDSPQDALSPCAHRFPISAPQGTVELPEPLDPGWSYEVNASVAAVLASPTTANATTAPLTSAASTATLAAIS